MKRLLLFTAVVVLAAACSVDGAGPTTAGAEPAPATPSVSTQPAVSNTSEETGTMPLGTVRVTPEIPADAPDAPDFVFTLGDGSDYHLGSDVKPVYLIFWAEW